MKICFRHGRMEMSNTSRLCNCSWRNYRIRYNLWDLGCSSYISLTCMFQYASCWPICFPLASTRSIMHSFLPCYSPPSHPFVDMVRDWYIPLVRSSLYPDCSFLPNGTSSTCLSIYIHDDVRARSFTHCHVRLHANSCVCPSFICLFELKYNHYITI